MDPVVAQYEAYPYPARDPADEARRLVEGSPSHPLEIDHFLFGGSRDWSRPFRALVAGGGTGDGLVMLAQKLLDIRCPAEITYLDLSAAARRIAEARMAARGLAARFVTGDLAEAPKLGTFDYIDCCGVLHHLADPPAGFRALAQALAPDGGIGLMVYAPHGRTGVYPLQRAFGALLGADPPERRLALARPVVDALPETAWFPRNALLGDHRESDAGFYDLLLHGRDRAYTVTELDAALAEAGLARVSFTEPALYDPLRYLPEGADYAERVARLGPTARAQLAEDLSGGLKTHTLYAVLAARAETAMATGARPDALPHLRGVRGPALAQAVAARGPVEAVLGPETLRLEIPQASAPLLALADGRRTLWALAAEAGLDWVAFRAAWAPAARALMSVNRLHYSRGGRP